MSLISEDAIRYEKIKYTIAIIISSIIGLIFIIISIYLYNNPPPNPPSVTPEDQLEQKKPSSGWAFLSGCGTIFFLGSITLYFLTTNNTQINSNLSATQGIFESLGSVFILNNGGYFIEGE
jgi:hypothetical protein